MSDTSEKITKILSDPDSIKMISEIAESFMGERNDHVEDNTSERSENNVTDSTENIKYSGNTEAISQIASNLSSIVSNSDIENTVRLISALKPYMSIHRKQSADSVLKMLNLLRVVGGIGFSELSGLLGITGE